MTQAVVADFSFAWPSITAARLKQIPGLTGFIAYAGGYGEGKNISRAKFQELIGAGLDGMLVIEDNIASLLGGRAVGIDQGKRVMAAAKAVGYDTANCTLATGYDTDSHSDDWATVLAAMEGFASVVPHPGYYGDSDSIDYLHARHPEWFYWQSNSRSFSPKNPTPNAHLLQQYDHPLAHIAGLQSSIDINLVERTPLGFMGEEVDPLAGYTLDEIADAVWQRVCSAADGEKHQAQSWLMSGQQTTQDNAKALATVSQLVATLPTRVATVQANVTALAKAVAALKPSAATKADAAAIAVAVRDQIRTLVWGAK